LSFLQQADLGIQDIQVEIKKVQKEDLPNDLPQEFSKALLGQEISRIEFIHEISDGQSVRFSIEQESDGTKKMFELSGIWMDVLSEGKIIIIDEFDNSLHQHLLNFLIHKIHAQNPKGAQLIFTTHNVNLMEGNFRRDQFWFVERNRNNESRLYPLSKFSVRKGEAIKNNYLRGSYGAIPIIDED
ncbi:MAG: RloA protein, partial [SAR324 cluster bacterium]